MTKELFDFDVTRENLTATVNGVKIHTDKDAIIRLDTLEPIGIVSSDKMNYYNIVEHKELVVNARQALQEMGLDYTEKTDLTKNGARLYHTFDFPTETIEPLVGDFVNMRAVLRNSYDGTGKVGFDLGGVRLVCENGLTAYKSAFFMLKKHSHQFVMETTIDKFKKAVETFHLDVVGFFKVLGNTPLEMVQGMNIVKALIEKNAIPEKYGNAVSQVWQSPENANDIVSDINGETTTALYDTSLDKARNLWTFYNAFTLILTHCVKSIERRMVMHAAVQKQLKGLTR